MDDNSNGYRLSEDGVREDLQRQPHLLVQLAENSLTVAESLRDNYFKNTARFVRDLRLAMQRPDPILRAHDAGGAEWSSVQDEVVTFIDAGTGRLHMSSQLPLLLRVGSYCVRIGERDLSRREEFGYYPVVLGDLEGGSKQRADFTDIVRITAELLGGLAAIERTPDLRMLVFHGPLVYPMGIYAGHTPFTEGDIDLFLRQYAPDVRAGQELKEEFLRAAKLDIYPRMTDRSDEWVDQRVFEPLSWIAYLYRRLIQRARKRRPAPIIAGVVERGRSRDFIEQVLLERVFRGMRDRGRTDYFADIFNRADLKNPRALLDRLGYTDGWLLAMLLQPGQFSEPWPVGRLFPLAETNVSLPGEAWTGRVNFSALESAPIGFPGVHGCYVHVSPNTEPVRVEVFSGLGQEGIEEAARRVYLYSRLLPGYGFPVGLNIVDRYARVPNWLTRAYEKLVRYHLGVSLQQGEITDAEMRRILVQAIYMNHRDWLFRPGN